MLAERPVAWQRVLHGDSMLLREEVTKELLSRNGAKAAFRYSACGLGDGVKVEGDGARVMPRGCGHRLCPRCGRKRGAMLVRRVCGHLATAPHGDLWAVCLTQPVKRGESLSDAKARFLPKQKRYLRALKGLGSDAGLVATHIVWSMGGGGWHYHAHILCELPAGAVDLAKLRDLWAEVAAPEFVQTGDEMCRLVVKSGGPIPELASETGAMDFWSEDSNAVVRAIQYPLRDMAQGVSALRLGGDRERVRECVRGLLVSATGWRLRCAFGRWRKSADCVAPRVAEPVAEGEGPRSEKAAAPAPAKVVGTVMQVFRRAKRGEFEAREVMRRLEFSVKNSSDFAKRFVAFCRSAWCREGQVLNLEVPSHVT